jgi:hypothetical protein
MKRVKAYKYLIATAVLVLSQSIAMAQPLPPSDPRNARPVPVESIVVGLVAALAGLGITRLRKKDM